MPFASKSQQRYLFAKHPDVAEEFASTMSAKDYKKLPEHVEEHESGGMVCKACGGEVMHDGYAKRMFDGGEVEEHGEGQGREADSQASHGMEGGEGWEGEQREALEGMQTEQDESKRLVSQAAFANALRRRRG